MPPLVASDFHEQRETVPRAKIARGWIRHDGSVCDVDDKNTHDRCAHKEHPHFRYRSQAQQAAWHKGWVRFADSAFQIPSPDDAYLVRIQEYLASHRGVRDIGHVIIEWEIKGAYKAFLVPTEDFLRIRTIAELQRFNKAVWI